MQEERKGAEGKRELVIDGRRGAKKFGLTFTSGRRLVPLPIGCAGEVDVCFNSLMAPLTLDLQMKVRKNYS